jgi:WD40 repeat protein
MDRGAALKPRLFLILILLIMIPVLAQAQVPLEQLTPENAPQVGRVGWIRQPNRWQMLGMAWSPDGTTLAMTTNTGVDTTEFSAEGMRPARHYGNTSVKCATYSPDGRLLAACNSRDGTVFIWNAATGEQAAAVYTGRYAADGAEFSPDGTLLAVRNSFSSDEEVVLWGVWANGQRQVLTVSNAYRVQKLATFVHGVSVIDMSFNTDGSWLATISVSDDVMRVWDTASEELVTSRQLNDVYAVDFSSRYLAVSVNEVDITLLDAETFEDARTLKNPYRDMHINDLNFSPDGALVAISTNIGLAQVWDAESGELLNDLTGHPHIAWRLAFNPSGTLLASLGWNDGIRLWGIGGEIVMLSPPTATPAPTRTPTPVPALAVGGAALVRTTGGDVLNVRGSPSRQGERIGQLRNATPVVILDGPQEGDGLVWWKVRAEDGLEGWVVEAVDGEQTLIPD